MTDMDDKAGIGEIQSNFNCSVLLPRLQNFQALKNAVRKVLTLDYYHSTPLKSYGHHDRTPAADVNSTGCVVRIVRGPVYSLTWLQRRIDQVLCYETLQGMIILETVCFIVLS